ncbi:MAG: DUF4062 domain-containing protein [Thermoguttaceae bacterium]
MPSIQSPSVFVSSTCYDLSEVRDQLKAFIENYGFDPMMSEFNSFPINPLDGTIDNCRNNVDQRADIFVLIVGNRYGSTDDSGKSITNLEFLQAQAKGIPIYVFIKREILNTYPIWKANPNACFPNVDSPKLYEFVDSLQSRNGLWINPFDIANDIIDTLRNKWAFLFLDALQLWIKTRDLELSSNLRQLRGKALRILIDKPAHWEYIFYNQVLHDKLRELAVLKKDRDLGIISGECNRLIVTKTYGIDKIDKALSISQWVQDHIKELGLRINGMMKLFSEEVINDAFGPLGIPGNPENILYLADKLAETYRYVIEWSIKCKNMLIDDEYIKLFNLISQGVNNVILEIENYEAELRNKITDLIQNPPKQGETRHISICLSLSVPEGWNESMSNELNKIAKQISQLG